MSVDSLTTRPVVLPEVDGPVPTPWVAVCRLDDLVPERGAAALVAGAQVALFRLPGAGAVTTGTAAGAVTTGTPPAAVTPGTDEVLAVQQLDPFMDAHVMSRGIVGSRGDTPTVASPLLKQVFDLRTGRCLEPVGRAPRHLRTWRVRLENGVVLVAATPDPPVTDGPDNPGDPRALGDPADQASRAAGSAS